MMNCKNCEIEIDDLTANAHDGYCDDCVLETMDPEWVKEHYPDFADVSDEED
jgi:hypothetical protein